MAITENTEGNTGRTRVFGYVAVRNPARADLRRDECAYDSNRRRQGADANGNIGGAPVNSHSAATWTGRAEAPSEISAAHPMPL
jgi:hypothetical protein